MEQRTDIQPTGDKGLPKWAGDAAWILAAVLIATIMIFPDKYIDFITYLAVRNTP